MGSWLRTVLGRGALIEAARHGDSAEAQQRLDQGVDPHVADVIGMTPLHWVAIDGQLELVEDLIQRGAGLHVAECKGRASLEMAQLGRHGDVTRFLRDRMGPSQ